MDINKARLLLEKLGAEQDTEMISNEKEYYFRRNTPAFSFSIPKNGNISKAKWFKLIQLSCKILNLKEVSEDE